jgi:hypothetical protein
VGAQTHLVINVANYYATVTTDKGLKASRDEYNALKAALEVAKDDGECSGFEVEYYDGEVYVFAPESGDWEELPRDFLALLGALIAKNGLEFLEFGAAFTCDKPRIGSHGGTYFRVRSNGSLWEPTLTW